MALLVGSSTLGMYLYIICGMAMHTPTSRNAFFSWASLLAKLEEYSSILCDLSQCLLRRRHCLRLTVGMERTGFGIIGILMLIPMFSVTTEAFDPQMI